MLELTCPHCGFSKQIDQSQLPGGATRASCPRCKQSFSLPTNEPQQATSASPEMVSTVQRPLATVGHSQEEVDALPKAGFWIRVVATLIDGTLVFLLQLVLGLGLALTGIVSGGGSEEELSGLMLLVQLFSYVLSFAYYVFFTGYCGQTPGKMAVRVKVIRRDGTPISYLRAAFREVPAKFVSAIILGIGYLMVAFDDQKQGLHDRIADTYVIKL